MKKRTVLCFIVFLLFSALTTYTLVSCGETSATAEPEVKEPVSIENVENNNLTDEPKEQSILPISSPLEKGYVSEETLKVLYSSTMFCRYDTMFRGMIPKGAAQPINVLEAAIRRNIDDNYCYSVYETENGGTLFAFFLRDDTIFDRHSFKGDKRYIQYVAYVEKPMKMADFDALKIGDDFAEVLSIDPGTRYYEAGQSVHLCADGLVLIEFAPKDNFRCDEHGVIFEDLEIINIKRFAEFGSVGEDWYRLVTYPDSSYVEPDNYNPYFTLKIDPADYPQE